MGNLFNDINRIKYRDLGSFFKVRRKKTQTFYSQADRKRLTLPSYGQLFMNFCLILDYDYMCSETDFTKEKSHFYPTSRIHNSSLLFAAALSQNGQIAV